MVRSLPGRRKHDAVERTVTPRCRNV